MKYSAKIILVLCVLLFSGCFMLPFDKTSDPEFLGALKPGMILRTKTPVYLFLEHGHGDAVKPKDWIYPAPQDVTQGGIILPEKTEMKLVAIVYQNRVEYAVAYYLCELVGSTNVTDGRRVCINPCMREFEEINGHNVKYPALKIDEKFLEIVK